MSNLAYDKLLSVYTDNRMVKLPMDQVKQKLLLSILESHFKQLSMSEMDDIVNENYQLKAVQLRLGAELAFREELEKNKSEKYYTSFRKRNKYNDWIEVYKTEITALSVFLSQYFVENMNKLNSEPLKEVQSLMEYIRYILINKHKLFEIDTNSYTFSEDIDTAILEVNENAPIFGRVSNILLTVFAIIFISNLGMAIWYSSFGLLFWGIFLLSTLLPVAAYRGLKVLITSNDEKEKLNGWKIDILVKEKMEDIIGRTKKENY